MRWPLILALLLMASPVLADISGPARIIDGDTIDIAGERIRLHGIDAPESRQTCIADGIAWSCGQSATDALAEFIGGVPIRCEEQGTDRYGRTIATCYVQGEDIEHWMVLNGWALAYRRYSLWNTLPMRKRLRRRVWASGGAYSCRLGSGGRACAYGSIHESRRHARSGRSGRGGGVAADCGGDDMNI